LPQIRPGLEDSQGKPRRGELVMSGVGCRPSQLSAAEALKEAEEPYRIVDRERARFGFNADPNEKELQLGEELIPAPLALNLELNLGAAQQAATMAALRRAVFQQPPPDLREQSQQSLFAHPPPPRAVPGRVPLSLPSFGGETLFKEVKIRAFR
jgi:hypothetical protein